MNCCCCCSRRRGALHASACLRRPWAARTLGTKKCERRAYQDSAQMGNGARVPALDCADAHASRHGWCHLAPSSPTAHDAEPQANWVWIVQSFVSRRATKRNRSFCSKGTRCTPPSRPRIPPSHCSIPRQRDPPEAAPISFVVHCSIPTLEPLLISPLTGSCLHTAAHRHGVQQQHEPVDRCLHCRGGGCRRR